MNEANESVTFLRAEAERLLADYARISRDVTNQVVCMTGAFDLAQARPERLEEMRRMSHEAGERARGVLLSFARQLAGALHLNAELGAAPNGGPAEPLGASAVGGGPPSVS
jgi:hypothetical protein